MDLSTEIGAALTGVQAAFTTNLGAIVPVVFGIAALTLVYRRVKSLIR